MNEKHVAMWVYYTYRWHKDLPKWLQKDLERSKKILGINDGDKSYSKTYLQNL